MIHQKIRVMHLVNSLVVGGAERVVTMLATHADRSRFEVIPCAIRASGPLEEDLRAASIHYEILGIRRRSIANPMFLADIRRLLVEIVETARRFRVDIIHAHLTENTLLAVLAARRLEHLKVCATVHSVVFSPQRGPLSLRGWLKRTGSNHRGLTRGSPSRPSHLKGSSGTHHDNPQRSRTKSLSH